MARFYRKSSCLSKTVVVLGIPALALAVFVLWVFLSLNHKAAQTEMELNPARRIAHDMQVVREHPNAASAHQQLANSYVFGHRKKEAVQEYQEAVRLSHGEVSSGLYYSLAMSLFAIGQRTQAREALKLEVKSDAPACQVVPYAERYVAEVTCQPWIAAKEMLKKYP